MDSLWLPEGAHTDLNIEHAPGLGAGAFTGGGWKMCWHVTVSPWNSVDAMVSVLKSKRAEPHLVIGGRPGFKFPVVVQLLPFNVAGRALVHNSGPETNRANCIQVEICARPGNLRAEGEQTGLFDMPGFNLTPEEAERGERQDVSGCLDYGDRMRAYESGVAAWTEDTYKALANLGLWVENRVPIPRRCARTFKNTKRFTGPEFVKVAGHLGHMHVPGNTHYDPTTSFKGQHLMTLMNHGPFEL